MSPALPPELERAIFEEVALSAQKLQGLLPLILVARRVRIWIEPFLYRILMKVGCSKDYRYPPTHEITTSGTQVARFRSYAKHVKHLMLQGMENTDAADILKECKWVKSLALWRIGGHHSIFLPILKSLRVESLSVEMDKLFRNPEPDAGPAPPFGFSIDPTVLSHLTHLDILCMEDTNWELWKPLTRLPCLTHLALDKFSETLIHEILNGCARLQLLILFYNNQFWFAPDYAAVDSKTRDERIVLMREETDCLQSWEEAAHLKGDTWDKAEHLRGQMLSLEAQFLAIKAEVEAGGSETGGLSDGEGQADGGS